MSKVKEQQRICKGVERWNPDCTTVLSRYNPNDICQACIRKIPSRHLPEFLEMKL
jgi:hypothetical protein